MRAKYFVLKPNFENEYGISSVKAMKTYAEHIKKTNPELADDIFRWIDELDAMERGNDGNCVPGSRINTEDSQMTHGWIVVREEIQLETKHWVCLCETDALRIAEDVVNFWEGAHKEEGTRRDLYEDQIFHVQGENFRVYVMPQVIRSPGEAGKL